jgi:hypothetical protein
LGFDLGIGNSRFGKKKLKGVRKPPKKLKTIKAIKVESGEIQDEKMQNSFENKKKISIDLSMTESILENSEKNKPSVGFKNSVSELEVNSSSLSKKSKSSSSSMNQVNILNRLNQNVAAKKKEIH